MAKERFNDRLKDELYQLAMGDKDIAESEFAGIYLTSKNPIKTKSHDFGKKIKFHLKRHFSISIDLEDWKLVYNIWIVWTDDEWYEIEDTFQVENICRKFVSIIL